MAVVNIREVRMPVDHRRVPMPVGMRLSRLVGRRVNMPVVLVMDVPMVMVERLVGVLMLVTFDDVNDHARRDEDATSNKGDSDRVAEKCDAEGGAEERRG